MKILALIRTIAILSLLWLIYNREPVAITNTEYVLINSVDEIPSGKLVRIGLTVEKEENE
tara:strand:+ start:93 stop:272 length:180 start_codon:yes stop_codon:yes gene_type:complete